MREAAMNGDEDLEVHDGMARRLQPDRLLWEDGGGAQGAPSSAGGALPHASSEFALTAHARVAQRLLSVSMVQSRAQRGRSAASMQRRIADDLEWSLLHGNPERILQAAALQAPAASTFFLAARTPSVLQSIERQQSEGARLLRDRLALAATVAVLAAAVTEPACDWWQPPGSATLIRAAHLGVVHCAKLPLASLGHGAALRIAAITRDARVSTFSAQSAKLLPAATRVHPRRLTSSSSTLSASATGAATVTLTLQAPPQPDDTLSILGFLVMRQQCVEQPVEESARGAGLLVQAVGPYTCTDFGHPVIVEFTQQQAERFGDASASGSSVQLALTGLAPGGTYAWVAAAVTAAT
ncbi:MAG: hypothetical protein EOO41_03310, partial [Methanobacteriota archaeon]